MNVQLCYQKLLVVPILVNGRITGYSYAPAGDVTRFNNPASILEETLDTVKITNGMPASPYPVSTSVKNLEGTYDVGYCVKQNSGSPAKGLMVTGWFAVTTPEN